MKKILLSAVAVCMLATASFAQLIPNGDFEQPISGGQLPGFNVFGGVVSQLTSITVNTSSGQQTLYPVGGQYFARASNNTTVAVLSGKRYAFTARPNTLRFSACYFPQQAGENFLVAALLTKYNADSMRNDTIAYSFGVIGGGTIFPWTDVTVNMVNGYKSSDNPDSAQVVFVASFPAGFQNTTLLLDNVKWSQDALSANVNVDLLSAGLTAWPNPARDQVNLTYTLHMNSKVSVDMYDIQGRKLRSVVESTDKGYGTYDEKIDISDLKAGIYLLKVSAGNTVKTVKFAVAE